MIGRDFTPVSTVQVFIQRLENERLTSFEHAMSTLYSLSNHTILPSADNWQESYDRLKLLMQWADLRHGCGYRGSEKSRHYNFKVAKKALEGLCEVLSLTAIATNPNRHNATWLLIELLEFFVAEENIPLSNPARCQLTDFVTGIYGCLKNIESLTDDSNWRAWSKLNPKLNPGNDQSKVIQFAGTEWMRLYKPTVAALVHLQQEELLTNFHDLDAIDVLEYWIKNVYREKTGRHLPEISTTGLSSGRVDILPALCTSVDKSPNMFLRRAVCTCLILTERRRQQEQARQTQKST